MESLLKKYNDSVGDVVNIKKKVKKQLDNYEKKLKEAKKPTHEPQDDGWITVHRRGGRDPTRKHSKKAKKKKNDDEKLINFYSFEVKESKLKKHKELLEKFEEDKKKLAAFRSKLKSLSKV